MPAVPASPTVRGLRRLSRARGSAAPAPESTESAIGAALVRASVGALGAGRRACRHCHRVPLVGECVYVYCEGRRGDELVCELCRPLRAAPPDRTVRVRSPEQLGSVRAIAARP